MTEPKFDKYNRLPTLYAKSATGTVQIWICSVRGDQVWVEWGQEGGTMQQSSFTCTPKNEGRANATTAAEQAQSEALSHWRKQIKKKYHTSKVSALTSFNLKPMLAKSFKDRASKIVYPVYVQPKFDGVRCLAYLKDGSVVLQSRGGDPYDVEHIRSQIQNAYAHCIVDTNIVLDGELYVHGNSLQTTISWVKRSQEDSLKIQYHVYDLAHLPGGPDNIPDEWKWRIGYLRSCMSAILPMCPSLVSVDTYTANSMADVKVLHYQFVQAGYEGAIIRLAEGVYKFAHRSSELLKYKDFQDAEFRIIGWKRGKGKFENVPIFRCVTPKGVEFDVAPKGTEADRAEMLRTADDVVGEYLKVRFFTYTDDGAPQFPVGIIIRGQEDM